MWLQKSNLYIAGAGAERKQAFQQMTGFQLRSFPYYLGMPLNPSRWTSSDYEFLFNCITARIRCWATRHLSFAGRCQLINSVLFPVENYRSAVFISPQRVFKQIINICRCFLWKQKEEGRCMAYVNWEQVCLLKRKGGLQHQKLYPLEQSVHCKTMVGYSK